VVDLVCREFVAVAINGRMTMGRDNVEGKFVREGCQLRLAGAGGNLVAVTASGKVLEKNWTSSERLRIGLRCRQKTAVLARSRCRN
jgi:hypothetical protein